LPLLKFQPSYSSNAQHVITTTTRKKCYKTTDFRRGQWNTAYDLESH